MVAEMGGSRLLHHRANNKGPSWNSKNRKLYNALKNTGWCQLCRSSNGWISSTTKVSSVPKPRAATPALRGGAICWLRMIVSESLSMMDADIYRVAHEVCWQLQMLTPPVSDSNSACTDCEERIGTAFVNRLGTPLRNDEVSGNQLTHRIFRVWNPQQSCSITIHVDKSAENIQHGIWRV